jgi:hypothetical protein
VVFIAKSPVVITVPITWNFLAQFHSFGVTSHGHPNRPKTLLTMVKFAEFRGRLGFIPASLLQGEPLKNLRMSRTPCEEQAAFCEDLLHALLIAVINWGYPQ